MPGDGDLLLGFLRLTGWRVEIYCGGSAAAGFAERPPGRDEPRVRVTASAPTRAATALELFAQACDHLYARRPAAEVTPPRPRT